MTRLSLLIVLLLLSACATTFPRPEVESPSAEAKASGGQLFSRTFVAHGGANIEQLANVNVGITGKWKQLIRRIQPLVTDFKYRVDSQERLIISPPVYASQYQGPAGRKSVFRSADEVTVHYNGELSSDAQVLSSTALTADAFHLFLLGPLNLEKWRDQFVLLPQKKLNGTLHERIYLQREPGFGLSNVDEIVLWIDPETDLTTLVQITLEGHASTQGAHVEVEYLDYTTLQDFVFPSRFFERVNAPIAIDAHAWQLTGIDINRDYASDDLKGAQYLGEAAKPALPLQH